MMKARLTSGGRWRLRNGRLALTVGGGALPPTGEGATVIALTDFASDYTVLQRVGTSKTFTVSGTTDGTAPIQARVVNKDTGAVIVDWTTIDAAPADGVFAGPLTAPQGCWYELQTRDSVSGVTANSARRFGVGIIGLLIGQSNMVNRRTTGLKNPLGDKRAIECRTGVFKRAGNVNDSKPANYENDEAGYTSPSVTVQSGRSDGFILLANLLAQGLDLPVCLVEKANGGSFISSWDKTLSGHNWDAAVAELNLAGGDCEFALLHLGESDANLMSKAEFKTRMGNVMAQCHAQTGRSAANFKFGVVALGSGSYGGSSEGEFGNMRAAHVEFATSTPGAYLSTSAHDVSTSDGVHINGEGYNRMVKRDARSLLHAFGVGVSGAGPYATGATRNGLEVRLHCAHSGGTALLDGAGGNGAALTGFQFLDGDAALAYTASLIDGNDIVLTLASLPAGALTLSYGMANCPHNSTPTDSKTAVVLASVPYDNVALHRTTNGCPLQPFSAIAVN